MKRNKITERLKALQFHIDRNIISYGICVVIASILWFLNALNKEYTSKITYPVKYTDFPQGKFLVSDPPQNISLEVKAKAPNLLPTHCCQYQQLQQAFFREKQYFQIHTEFE